MKHKYESLEEYLQQKSISVNELTLRFRDIEDIIGARLPKSAFQYREWWSNQSDVSNRPQAKAWVNANYKVDEVCLDAERGWVRFKLR